MLSLIHIFVAEVEATGLDVVTLPHRQNDAKAYARAFKYLLASRHFDVIHVCCNSGVSYTHLDVYKRQT